MDIKNHVQQFHLQQNNSWPAGMLLTSVCTEQGIEGHAEVDQTPRSLSKPYMPLALLTGIWTIKQQKIRSLDFRSPIDP
jgi:hypothetical protein